MCGKVQKRPVIFHFLTRTIMENLYLCILVQTFSRRVFCGHALRISIGHVFFIADFICQGFVDAGFQTTDLFGF